MVNALTATEHAKHEVPQPRSTKLGTAYPPVWRVRTAPTRAAPDPSKMDEFAATTLPQIIATRATQLRVNRRNGKREKKTVVGRRR